MTQMKIFAKFHLNNFYLLIVPYHAAKFEKILRADPEIQTCIIWATMLQKFSIWPK